MRVKKLVSYKSLNVSNSETFFSKNLELNILNKSGNYLIHKNIVRHHTMKAQGTVNTKTRSEVRGGGRKPWKQKGTGRARAGSNRSPLWKGGGVMFGPKLRTNRFKLNKKERKLALQTLLYNKKNQILILENLDAQLRSLKTKQWVKLCQKNKIDYSKKILLIVDEKTKTLKLTTRNIQNLELINVLNINSFDLIKVDQILITRPALTILQNLII